MQNIGPQERKQPQQGQQYQQQEIQPGHAGPSSSTNGARHTGHSQAREHPAGYQPGRQIDNKGA